MAGRRAAPYGQKIALADQYLRIAETGPQIFDLDGDGHDQRKFLVFNDLGPAVRRRDFFKRISRKAQTAADLLQQSRLGVFQAHTNQTAEAKSGIAASREQVCQTE